MTILFAAFESDTDYTLNAGNGGTVSATDGISPYNTYVGLRFLTTGAVQKVENTDGGPSWSAHGTWISDAAEITGNEEVRFTNLSVISGPGDWSVEAAADDTWISLASNREWYRNLTTAGTREFNCDFQVRDTVAGKGPVTVSYTFLADNVI